MKLRHLMFGMLLLCVAGCGCEEVVVPRPGSLIVPAVFQVGTSVPPIGVERGDPGVIPIDVFFVMDDSVSMEEFAPTRPDRLTLIDYRKRTLIAQRVFAKLRSQVKAQLIAKILMHPTLKNTVSIADLDFAFGVGRFEDFGGTEWLVDPASGADLPGNNDATARPFVLNMPVLRELHPDFVTNFDEALKRRHPGNGNPSTALDDTDPQSALEALYQIAAGPGNPVAPTNGFDGNNNGSTLDDGQPCSVATQDSPADSGDVPGVLYGPRQSEPLGGDPSRPQYNVRDDTNADGPCVASGNIGGVGWREGSARFVILATDIATVTPLETVDPDIGGIGDPPYDTAALFGPKVTSNNGSPAGPGWREAPRQACAIPVIGFRGARTNPETSRFGLPGQPSLGALPGTRLVAPWGAHKVQETVTALNALGIEVLTLATPTIVPNDTKPTFGNTEVVNGETASTHIDDVVDFEPTITPWTFLTGLTRLTGAVSPFKDRDTPATTNPLVDFKRADPDTTKLGLVYDMHTLWPYDPNDATGQDSIDAGDSDVKLNMVEDLVDRLIVWLEGNYLPHSGGGSGGGGPLPTVIYDFKLTLGGPAGATVSGDLKKTDANPTDTGTDNEYTISVPIPVYYYGDAVPADVVVTFPEFGSFTYDLANPTDTTPVTDDLNILIEASYNTGDSDPLSPGTNSDHFQIDMEITNRASLQPQTDGQVTLTVRGTDDPPGPSDSAVINAPISNGCLLLNDLVLGGAGPQSDGNCPHP